MNAITLTSLRVIGMRALFAADLSLAAATVVTGALARPDTDWKEF